MRVISIGPDAVALKIDSASDHVRLLTPEELAQNHVSDAVVTIYRNYFHEARSDAVENSLNFKD